MENNYFKSTPSPLYTFAYQDTSDALGGQRDIILDTELPPYSTAVVSINTDYHSLVLSTSKTYSGSLVVLYDGIDCILAYEGHSLNTAPGIGSAEEIPECNSPFVDFTSFGRACGIHVTTKADNNVQWIVSAFDSYGGRNDYVIESEKYEGGPVSTFMKYDDFSCEDYINCWNNPYFDWTEVAAIQMNIVISPEIDDEVLAVFSDFDVRGSEIPVCLTEVDTCES
eukprot:CAMPEP_0206208444 /NCGR_PEP_ID=MMETSP0166-20121206/16270_1 /ASSEMBLY_ACC=CAM_ASM_000260 /TAXON_ID=95228 /ORGANISM="Vannella robusta, Strain DIVA3 518/3/11/1/6" /LENGTH=224 /DNA_ID=CAMNT_0053629557 /DNA_START=49 /DNA_END=720 /DNA_ORIENTATION=-